MHKHQRSVHAHMYRERDHSIVFIYIYIYIYIYRQIGQHPFGCGPGVLTRGLLSAGHKNKKKLGYCLKHRLLRRNHNNT